MYGVADPLIAVVDQHQRRSPVTISVFLLDDHEIVRRGIGQLLETVDDIEVVGEAGTAAQAMARIPALRPNVAILDVRLPDGDGITVCRDIRSTVDPPPACLMLTSYSDDEALFGAIMAGAAGYLLKQVAGTDLIGAVRTVAGGGSLLDPRATALVLERLRRGDEPDDPRYESLSPQERRILELVADGLTNRQIGAEMYLAEKTVKNYVSSLLHKLGLGRRTEAAVYATERRQQGARRRAMGLSTDASARRAQLGHRRAHLVDDPVEREHRLRDPLAHLGVADARQRRLQGQARGEQLLDHLVVPLMGQAGPGGRVVGSPSVPDVIVHAPPAFTHVLHSRPWRGTGPRSLVPP